MSTAIPAGVNSQGPLDTFPVAGAGQHVVSLALGLPKGEGSVSAPPLTMSNDETGELPRGRPMFRE